VDYTLCCDGSFAQIVDPLFWEPNGNNLTICSCSAPSVGGTPFTGEVTQIGSCGDCVCADVNIVDQDIVNSDNGMVYLYYQCCDGSMSINQYPAQQQQFICLANVIGIFYYFRGQFVPAPLSTATLGGSCTVNNYCVGCNSAC
jgi:hypothetical protein